MEFNVTRGTATDAVDGVLVIVTFEDENMLRDAIAAIDRRMNGAILKLCQRGEISGKFKEIGVVHTLDKIEPSKILVAGLGKRSEFDLNKLRTTIAEVGKKLGKKASGVINLVVPENLLDTVAVQDVGQCIAEGAILGTYSFNKYVSKIEDNKDGIGTINVIIADEKSLSIVKEGCERGRIIAEATNFARDQVNEPANYLTPETMAETAMQMANRQGLEIQILEKDEIKNLGMGGLAGVSAGSNEPPKFIVITYRGKAPGEIDIALVGKGVTFDSGGISIKPSEGMGDMKGDMAGGAAVLAVISAVAQFKPRVNVMAIIPATENLPDGKAMKPGDIIKIMNGKTVEIVSTDAEGRLILADGLAYAVKMGARRIIDVATLTGACRIALGDVNTGAFGNDDDLTNLVVSSAARTGEHIWRMPMNEEYKEQNKTEVADIKNTGGRYGGAITAALFLSEFVNKIPWVHLDIAGTSMADKETGYRPKGATGVPVRTLIGVVLSLAENNTA